MRRLRFATSESETVQASAVLAWAWVDRLPEALVEFAMVSAVRPGAEAGTYTLVLGPVGYEKVSMALQLEMRATRDAGSELRMQSLAGGRGNADATVVVSVRALDEGEQCELTISLDVSPHKPAAAFWPREWIEKASSASLGLAARKMLSDMKAAIEGGRAEARLEASGLHGIDLASSSG